MFNHSAERGGGGGRERERERVLQVGGMLQYGVSVDTSYRREIGGEEIRKGQVPGCLHLHSWLHSQAKSPLKAKPRQGRKDEVRD